MGNISEKLQTLNGLIDQLIANQGSGGGGDKYGTRVDLTAYHLNNNARVSSSGVLEISLNSILGETAVNANITRFEVTPNSEIIIDSNMKVIWCCGDWPDSPLTSRNPSKSATCILCVMDGQAMLSPAIDDELSVEVSVVGSEVKLKAGDQITFPFGSDTAIGYNVSIWYR